MLHIYLYPSILNLSLVSLSRKRDELEYSRLDSFCSLTQIRGGEEGSSRISREMHYGIFEMVF